MKNYYGQTHDYLQRLVSLVVQMDRNEVTWEGVSVNLLEFSLLRELSRTQGQTFQEMMEKTGRSRNEMTAMLRRLIKQQLIQKGTAHEDRRVRRLVLTALGVQFLDAMEETTQALVTGLLNDFSFNEEKAILKFLVRLDMVARGDELAHIRQQVGEKMKK